jgi:MEMO1 family protein
MGKILGRYITPHPPLIVPEIGQGEECKVKKTVDAMERVAEEIGSLKPETIVLITPHGPLFKDAIAVSELKDMRGDFSSFGRSDIEMVLEVDLELTSKIVGNAFREGIPVVPITNKSIRGYDISGNLDHGAMVPLYYINRHLKDYKVVHITYGMIAKDELYNFGLAVKSAVESMDSDAVVIASGDLSHRLSKTGPYSYSPRGEEFDRKLIKALQKGKVEEVFCLDSELTEEAGECGLRSIYILLGTMDELEIEGELMSYEGTFGVGYGVMRFKTLKGSKKSLKAVVKSVQSGKFRSTGKNPYLELAKKSLEHYIEWGYEMPLPGCVPEELKKVKRGVFVSFKKRGELRGCVGTIYPTTGNVAEEIVRNAVEAGLRDPRFSPIGLDEIEELEVSVDELMEPEVTSREGLDPDVYGIIVTSGMRRGLLLPKLEGVDTVEHQLSIALQKAGIEPDEDYTIERFKVIRHSQKDSN